MSLCSLNIDTEIILSLGGPYLYHLKTGLLYKSFLIVAESLVNLV